MIPIREIMECAREAGVPPSTIERDYAQNWFLSALQHANLVFKGGTCIRKVFIENYRFSDDLDFTLPEQIGADAVLATISNAIVQVREESGIPFEDNPGLRQTRTGFKATVRFRILNRASASPVKIDLDLTDPGDENLFLPVTRRTVFHQYSDDLPLAVTSYSLEEIMAEKIRSLFQRTRSRDLYDVGQLADRVDRSIVKSVLFRKCEPKGIAVDSTVLAGKREQFSALWQVSLGHQMKAVPDFGEAFEKVLTEIDGYSA